MKSERLVGQCVKASFQTWVNYSCLFLDSIHLLLEKCF